MDSPADLEKERLCEQIMLQQSQLAACGQACVKHREMAQRLAFALRDAVRVFQPNSETTVTEERVEAWVAVLKQHDAGY